MIRRFTPVPSYAAGTSEVPLLGDTIGGVLDRIAADSNRVIKHWWRCRPAGDGRTQELRGAVEDVALGLLAAGVGRGDRVGIWAPNVAEWTLVQFGSAKIGAILVNINPAYRSHELEYVLTAGRYQPADGHPVVQNVQLRGDD